MAELFPSKPPISILQAIVELIGKGLVELVTPDPPPIFKTKMNRQKGEREKVRIKVEAEGG